MAETIFNVEIYKIPSKEILRNRQVFYGLWRSSDDETATWLKRVQNCIHCCDFPTIIMELLLFDRFVCGLDANELESLQSVNESWTLKQLLEHCQEAGIISENIEVDSKVDNSFNQTESTSLNLKNPAIVNNESDGEESFQANPFSESVGDDDPFAEIKIRMVKEEQTLTDDNTAKDVEGTNNHLSAIVDVDNSESILDIQNKKRRRRKRKHDLKTTHPKEKRSFPCDECNKSFTEWSNLSQHKRFIHRKVLSFMCEQCGKAFAKASCLRRHSITHTGERAYACDECDKSFPHKNNLARHKMSVHRGIRSHVCKECSKCFIASSDLQRHSRVHTKTTTSETVGM